MSKNAHLLNLREIPNFVKTHTWHIIFYIKKEKKKKEKNCTYQP